MPEKKSSDFLPSPNDESKKVDKSTKLEAPKISVNPLTGLPFGGQTINPETGILDKNPLTGESFGLGIIDAKGRVNYGNWAPTYPTTGGRPGDFSKGIHTDSYTRYNTKPMEHWKDYDVPMGRHFNWEEIRARNQSTTETILNGVGKSLVTFGGAILENTIGFFAGLGELATGGAYYDNAIGKTVDKWNNWAEEAMPIYLTEAEQDYTTWQKMGTAHFWADDVLGGMSYTAAAIASIYLTGGGGLVTKAGKTIASATIGRTAFYNSAKAVINGTKLAKELGKGATLTNRLYRATQVLEAGAMMSFAEASVESRETQRSTYNMLVENYLKENSIADIDGIPQDKLKEFEKVSYAAGNTNFVMQLPILMGSNLLMFGRSVSGFKAASQINKDVIWNAASEAYISKLANRGFMSSTLARLKPLAVQGLNEAFQESFQYGSSAFSSKYHADKYHNGGYGDISKALAHAFDEMGTQEGLESALIGFITGGVMGGGRSIVGKEYSNRQSRAEQLATLLNGGTMINAAAQYQNANTVAAASARMEMSLRNGDIKGYQDARFELIAAQTLEMIERGGVESYIEQLQESSTLPEAEFKKLYGYLAVNEHGEPISLEKQTNGKNQHEVIDGIVEKIRNFEKVYDNVHERFPLPTKTTGLPRLLMSEADRVAEDAAYNRQANLRNELVLTGANIKDRNRRMANIQKETQATIEESLHPNESIQLDIFRENSKDISMSEVLDEQQPEHKGTKEWTEPTFKDKQDALVGDVVGIDEQGNRIYAPGAEIDPNKTIEEQDISEVKQPDRYDSRQQLLNTIKKLQIVEDRIRQTDPIAADRIAELNKDYINLLAENNEAIDRYNKLASNRFAQKVFQEELRKAQDGIIQKRVDESATKAMSEAKTADELRKTLDPTASEEVQIAAKERYNELRKDEKAAYRKYYDKVKNIATAEAKLKELKEIDTADLTESEKEGLRQAIDTIRQQAIDEKLKKGPDQNITEEDVSTDPRQDIEDAFKPENVGGVESISEDARTFQIDGATYYITETNPIDAVKLDEKANIQSITLMDEKGNTVHMNGPKARLEALYYAILQSEQYKVDSEQGLSRQDILDIKTVTSQEVADETTTTIPHGEKDSSSLRSEIYSLEQSLNKVLELYDNLKTSLIQDNGATKQEISQNKDIKDIKSDINKLKKNIKDRKNILRKRQETLIPSSEEILNVESKTLNDVSILSKEVSKSEEKIKDLEDKILETERAMERYANLEDRDSYDQASEENEKVQNDLENELENRKNLERRINYKRQKLERIQNEKDKQLTRSSRQTSSESTRSIEGPVTEGQNQDVREVTKETQVTIANQLGYDRVNNNNYIMIPSNLGIEYKLMPNTTSIIIPSDPDVTAFLYKDPKDNTVTIYDSLTGTELGKGKTTNQAIKAASENLQSLESNVNNFKTIIEQNGGRVSPAFEPINTVEEQENFTNSEQETRRTLTLDKGKVEISNNTPEAGPGQRGGFVVMSQSEVEQMDKETASDLEALEGKGARPFVRRDTDGLGTAYLEGSFSDAARAKVKEVFGPRGELINYLNSSIDDHKRKYPDYDVSKLTPEKAFETFKDMLDFIDRQVTMHKLMVKKGKPGLKIEDIWNNLNYKFIKPGQEGSILGFAPIGEVSQIKEYIKRKMGIIEDAATISPAQDQTQIKKSEYEVHVTGDMLGGWDMQKYKFNVPGIKIRDLRFPKPGTPNAELKKLGLRTFEESIQNGKKVFTIVDHSINRYKSSRKGGISASMVFDENTTHTLEDVQGNLQAIMDSLMMKKEDGRTVGEITPEIANFEWGKLDIKEIATPTISAEEFVQNLIDEGTKSQVDQTPKVAVDKNATNVSILSPWIFDNVKNVNDTVNIGKEISRLKRIGSDLDNKIFKWKFGDIKAIIDGRRVVSINIPETGESFFMYKSVSENTWVPIPGWAKDGWFIKQSHKGTSSKLNKYDVNEFKEIAILLEALENDFFSDVYEVRPERSVLTNLSMGMAIDTKTIGKNYKIPVTSEGTPISYDPDMFNGEPIDINKAALLDPNLSMKEVEFELILNDWFTNNYKNVDENNWNEAPIYISIDGTKIGKLEKSNSEDRKVLVDKLLAGERVFSNIDTVITSNFNHTQTEGGESFFFNPEQTMGKDQVLLVFSEFVTEDGISNAYWSLGEVNEAKNQGDLDQIQNDLYSSDRNDANIDPGQIGIIIRPKDNPQNIARVSMASTANLSEVAKSAVIEALKNKNHTKASEIVSNSVLRQTANVSPHFLEFFNFKDGTNMMVYKSPKADKLIRINEHELAKALNGKNAKFGFVTATQDNANNYNYEQINKDKIKPEDYNIDIKSDFENFLNVKKYHVNRSLGNSMTPYTSPVHPNHKYNTYQEYLFSEREINSERAEGVGHNSIISTDLIKIEESFFNNPKITFNKGSINGNTAQTIKHDVKPLRDVTKSEENEIDNIAKDMGLLDDENIPDCPL